MRYLSIRVIPQSDKCFLYRLLIGEIDEALDKAVDLSTVRAEPLASIRY